MSLGLGLVVSGILILSLVLGLDFGMGVGMNAGGVVNISSSCCLDIISVVKFDKLGIIYWHRQVI